MTKKMKVGALIFAGAILLTGCSGNDEPPVPVNTEAAPLVSNAEGLGEKAKVDPSLYAKSQFSEVYESTQGKIDLTLMDDLDWKVERVFEAPEGEKLPKGDNFRATAVGNLTYNELVIDWVELLKADGWEAKNEISTKKPEKMDPDTPLEEDWRNNPYSVELSKGKSVVKVDITIGSQTETEIINGAIVVTVNSQ